MIDRSLLRQILPHKEPFLLVDQVNEFNETQYPSLSAEIATCYSQGKYLLDASEKYWPAAYLTEGLAQCCLLLSIFLKLSNEGTQVSQQSNSALQNIYEGLGQLIPSINMYQNNGLLAHVDLLQKDEVRVGEKVVYKVILKKNQAKLSQYAVEAKVNDETVIEGLMIGGEL